MILIDTLHYMDIVEKITHYSNSEYLFHGSPVKLDGFVSREHTNESYIYASNEFDYAGFLAIISLDEGGTAGVLYDNLNNFHATVSRGFVNGKSRLVPGYVYIVERKYFQDQQGNEWISDKEKIPIIDMIEIDPSYFDGRIVIKGE